MDRRSFKKKSKGKKMRRRIGLFVLLPLFLLASSALAYGGFLYIKAKEAADGSYEALNRNQSSLREEEVDPATDNVSVLFLGIDESEGRSSTAGFSSTSARTDAMILATLNNEDKTVQLVSIPRDTLAYIDEVGYKDKINHAHAFGGPEASMEAVEGLLDVPVDYYVRLNFNAFIDVVEALDGVQVDVPFEITEMDSNDKKDAITIPEGLQTLNGEEALAFSRSRHYDSDVARGGRQLEVINAIIKKSASIESINSYSEVIEALGNNMKTNMRFSEMRSFMAYAANSNLNVDMQSLEGEALTIDGIYYYQPYDTELANLQVALKEHLDLPTYASTTDESTDSWGEDPATDDSTYGESETDPYSESTYEEETTESSW